MHDGGFSLRVSWIGWHRCMLPLSCRPLVPAGDEELHGVQASKGDDRDLFRRAAEG